jgi:hypothetical protein
MVKFRGRTSPEEELRLERRADGQVWVCGLGAEKPVRVQRCFPWSQPTAYLSLRDVDDEEVALIAEPERLDASSRRVLEDALVEAGFVLEVIAIVDVDEEVEIRTWKVETRQGPRTFQTKLDDWPHEVPGGGVVIRDVAGDLYHVPHPAEMDAKSRKWLWAFVD